MRLANYGHRAALVLADNRALDIATASDGRFGPALGDIYDAWDEVVGWVGTVSPSDERAVPVDRPLLGAPSPEPRQVFAVGLNYSEHAAESGFTTPTDLPPVFTKYVSSFTGLTRRWSSRPVATWTGRSNWSR